MAQALIRNLEEDLLEDYRESARRSGRSLEADLREALRRARPLTPRRREEQASVDFGEQALAMALELRHPADDCFYLVPAAGLEVEMITADARLADRCRGTRFERHLRRL